LAYAALRESDVWPQLRMRPGFSENGLIRLGYPADYAIKGVGQAPTFAPWTTGLGACILESLQPELAGRWIAGARDQGRIDDWGELRACGRSQELVLDAFLPALEAAGRRDLARFLFQALAELLPPDAAAAAWIKPEASASVRLADRGETHRAALALIRQLERFRGWETDARSVGYFDEGYAASQLVKAEWERWQGDELTARAQRIWRELDPLNLAPEGRT
jgi:hypothetical protein